MNRRWLRLHSAFSSLYCAPNSSAFLPPDACCSDESCNLFDKLLKRENIAFFRTRKIVSITKLYSTRSRRKCAFRSWRLSESRDLLRTFSRLFSHHGCSGCCCWYVWLEEQVKKNSICMSVGLSMCMYVKLFEDFSVSLAASRTFSTDYAKVVQIASSFALGAPLINLYFLRPYRRFVSVHCLEVFNKLLYIWTDKLQIRPGLGQRDYVL